jgi:hypothetical protein
MSVLRVVMRDMGGYLYQMGRGVLRLVPREVMQGMAGYVRQVGKGVLMLVRCAVTQYVGGYLYQIGRGVLGLARRAVGFLEFEDGWDAAGYICLSFGVALMLLGTLAAPDLPALRLLGDEILSELPYCGTQYSRQMAPCRTRVPVPDCEPKTTGCHQYLNRCATCVCVLDGITACECYPGGTAVATVVE